MSMEGLVMAIEVGEKVPDFTLKDEQGEAVSLSQFSGKHVVLYFYPKDMTPGCTTQACDFRDEHQSFSDLNAVVLGVSPDEEESHQKFIKKHDLPFSLLVDKEHKLAEAFEIGRASCRERVWS